MSKALLFILAFSVVSANAWKSYVNTKLVVVEKHAENVNQCSAGSQSYLDIGLLDPATGAIAYVWISTSNTQYKDLESLALTALTAGLKVTAQADETDQVCGFTGGRLRFLTLSSQ
jgi:hypothetical protein